MRNRRFLTMDAMRGVAAIAVFTLHATALLIPISLARAHVAVDLFFVISGFVIDHAYRHRLEHGMAVRQFILARYIRLYPLYFTGFLIGAITSGIALVLGQGVLDVPSYLAALLSGMLMLPSPTWNQDAMAVPFNYPAWSLICEIAVNLIYVVTWRWWRLPALLTVTVMAGLALCLIGWRYGTTGYGTYWELYWIGYVRVLFSFVIGVAIRRVYTGRLTFSRLAWCVPLLPLLLFLGGGGVAGELATVLLLLPLLVYVAAHIEPVSGQRSFVLLGAISYPFYAIHIPIVQLVERATTVLHLTLASFAPWIGIFLCALIVAAALALGRWYDEPARGWLTKHLARLT